MRKLYNSTSRARQRKRERTLFVLSQFSTQFVGEYGMPKLYVMENSTIIIHRNTNIHMHTHIHRDESQLYKRTFYLMKLWRKLFCTMCAVHGPPYMKVFVLSLFTFHSQFTSLYTWNLKLKVLLSGWEIACTQSESEKQQKNEFLPSKSKFTSFVAEKSILRM